MNYAPFPPGLSLLETQRLLLIVITRLFSWVCNDVDNDLATQGVDDTTDGTTLAKRSAEIPPNLWQMLF